MDANSDDLCARIVNEIATIFNNNPNLSSFEVIPVQTNENRSPVILVENNLGLESWCVKHVYDYVHKQVLDYKESGNQYAKLLWNNQEIIRYLNVASLLNPDVSLFWNLRRNLYGHNKLSITNEFKFSEIILSMKPKSSEAFSYRRWLFLFMSNESKDFMRELSLCDRCADRNASNYHAWLHRLWVLEQDPELVRFEIMSTEKFIRRHVSDFSGFHHRMVILRKLLQSRYHAVRRGDELRNLIEDIISVRPASDLQILRVLLPTAYQYKSDKERDHWTQTTYIRSFLYCMHLAACDLKFVSELIPLFGERESFHAHRRNLVQFVYETCTQANRDESSEDRLTLSPVSKVIKLSHQDAQAVTENVDNDQDMNDRLDRGSQLFLPNLCRTEAVRSDRHRQWCKVFLDFNE